MIVFAIDPGVAGTGWAILKRQRHRRLGNKTRQQSVHAYTYQLLAAGNIYAKTKKGTFDQKSAEIVTALSSVISDNNAGRIDDFVCEFPTYMEGMAVSSKSDSTVKMAYIVGRIVEMIDNCYGVEYVRLYIPQQWKGTMKKELVERRCRKHVDFFIRAHAIDAIGIGLKHLGAW